MEVNTLYGSICLTDVPKELFKKAENGKIYLNMSVFKMKQPDNYGNEWAASCAPKQEERKEGVNYYFGKFKEYIPKENPQPADINNMPPAEDDDLPF